MTPDPRHCFGCDRRLLGPPTTEDERIRFCPLCQSDHDAYLEALGDFDTLEPRFGGVIGLGTPLPGWPTYVTVVGLELWGRFAEMSLVEVPGSNPPPPHPRALWSSPLGDHPPRKWVLTTDCSTVHHGGASGGGTAGTDRLLNGHTTIAPSLPVSARRLGIRAHAPVAMVQTSVDLADHPVTRRVGIVEPVATPADSDPDCPSCGPPSDAGSDCERCRSNRTAVCRAKRPTRPHPERVVALGAELGALFGSELVMSTLAAWPTWFDLSIVGRGPGEWNDEFGSGKRASRWTAHDDRGNTYTGAYLSGSGGLGLSRRDLSFTPALAADATTLTVTFPPSFDGQAYRATVSL